ncbi:MAG: DNA helicase UvrD [Candidatus Nealsonbacteria bacterium CG10_big_fil_rev_8_21_14_0_10_36_228]|uniref:DNA helicase UvrD n=3 Tax=Candidatus Nealsoniibacteriota TaxID=1817911 RepID=A0A2M7MFU7_9BACT|nr:MAG: DNA helicase UvrD [Candidatus Nealsonbacteria bacterium CG23_combo_of_CG06-09_8_20_14_all_36_125]PIR72323.1 MAG: DNA helicase UvrD [Candidatus Nealsonbacteria bacterium CG10_big_fil_rev_8_21_14_0_10_36_228]PIX88734.1 MAG: DNA helicase UvrD [Candidatus Nealsonbacteria bacterium CG_4_10_14_3_um_filter_36_16]
MKFIADFHLHSKYSRATSRDMNLENLEKWAKLKGIKVLGTGDFTHPEWLKNLKEKLEPAEPGLFKFKNSNSETRFILTTEVSCIYSKKGKLRKIHIIIFAPSFEVVEKNNVQLGWIGNLKSDGRPILGLDAKELAKIVFNVSSDCLVVPAHLMTPWFSLFGSKSGFNSLEECFDEYSKYIFAGETGLSANPLMLWRIPDGRKVALISNSDAHSPQKIGREANVFDTGLSYSAISEAIKTKDPKRFLYTIEFFPEEGKYHYDGHRICGISLSPAESKKYNNICPNCGRPLTIGVLNRVEQLSDREEGFKPENVIPFKSLVPLTEIIADALGTLVGTKQGEEEYKNLIEKFGNEFEILIDVSRSELETVTLPEIAEGIIRVREGKVYIEPGYDGIYGKIRIFSKGEQKTLSKQGTLF